MDIVEVLCFIFTLMLFGVIIFSGWISYGVTHAERRGLCASFRQNEWCTNSKCYSWFNDTQRNLYACCLDNSGMNETDCHEAVYGVE
jgi:hypothetical protein